MISNIQKLKELKEIVGRFLTSADREVTEEFIQACYDITQVLDEQIRRLKR